MQIRLTEISARRGGEEIALSFELYEDVFDSGALAVGRRAPGRELKELVILTERYAALRPKRGIIEEELYLEIEEAARFSDAVKSGMRMLSCGMNTKVMLEKKLVNRGVSRETAQSAVLYIVSKGLIDEDADVQREVECRLANFWGRNRIRSKLYMKGFDNKELQTAERYMETIDFSERCAELIRRRYMKHLADPAMHKKMAATLMRCGYTMNEIRSAVRSLD
jgi:SOS response regulatory protein OraA/RecX